MKKRKQIMNFFGHWGQVIGQCEALTPAPNVAEKKLTKGASPTGVLRSREPP